MPSSVIIAFSYNEEKLILKITFVSGFIYHYKNVPKNIYNAMRAATSKGTYFNNYIKDRYDFEKID